MYVSGKLWHYTALSWRSLYVYCKSELTGRQTRNHLCYDNKKHISISHGDKDPSRTVRRVLFFSFICNDPSQYSVSVSLMNILWAFTKGQEIRRWIPWRRTGGWTGCGRPGFSPGPAGCRSRGCREARRTAAAWTAPARSAWPCSSGSSPRCRTPSLEHPGTDDERRRRGGTLLLLTNIKKSQT